MVVLLPPSTLTKWILGVEAVAVFLVAAMLGMITLWGVMGISDLQSLLTLLAFIVSAIGCIAMVDLLRRGITMTESMGLEAVRMNVVLALLAAMVCALATLLSNRWLTADERWVSGMDFLAPGCILWVPIVHLAWLMTRSRLNERTPSTP